MNLANRLTVNARRAMRNVLMPTLLLSIANIPVFSQDKNEVTPKPPIMGWSSWNNFRVNIDEKMIREQADAMASSAMYDAGYRFINIDDGYFGGRTENGTLYCDSSKFPSGMKALADYIHRRGLKAGIYSDAGDNTCGSMWDKDEKGLGVGLYGHVQQDCHSFFTDWGFDFLKVDWCGGEHLKLNEKEEYTKIISAVKAIDPSIVFNICRWRFPGTWAIHQADSWRISGDIRDEFNSILQIIDLNAGLAQYCSPGHYNDMDMLQVGRGMNYEEDKTHFSMWCMMNSPLLAGNDLRNMSDETLSILTNTEVIALNQDSGFKQAVRILERNGIEIWTKPLGNDGQALAVAVMNRNKEAAEFELTADQLGADEAVTYRDLWEHEDKGPFGNSQRLQIPGHGIVVFRME